MTSQNKSWRRGITLYELLGVLLLLAFIVILALPALKPNRRSRRNELLNNAKQLGLGTHNFYSATEQLPPPMADGTTNPEVTKPISFFTSLLPYCDHSQLYEKIDTGEAWTHLRNREAYGTRVKGFEWPADTAPYYENDKTPAGYAITYFTVNSRLISTKTPVRFEEISDGLATTILAGTIDDASVPAWGDPRNRRDPANGFAGGANAFGGPEYGAAVVFADGRASSVSAEIDPTVARALATPAGGDIVEDYW